MGTISELVDKVIKSSTNIKIKGTANSNGDAEDYTVGGLYDSFNHGVLPSGEADIHNDAKNTGYSKVYSSANFLSKIDANISKFQNGDTLK